ncbi:MAG: MetQ/NlpA family ABC transporter substrate-binding protein [Peptococcaceae bacterium]|nr:MetQ/NlpA family ABC transporter substrate-binding protein [Peptococcaceae bacterium]
MKKRKWLASALVATLAVGLLAGCGGGNDAASTGSAAAESSAQAESSGSDDKTITIGASPSPHAEILNQFADKFEEKGYKLEVVEFTDYVQPNNALEAGDLDANYFQHKPYLDNFNEENGTDLVSAGAVHYEPMGIFSDSLTNLDSIPDGAKIAVPNDTTNEARALLLLQENGIITLKEGADITATKVDIAENPKNVEIVELAAEQIPRSLPDVDLGVINGNVALAAGLNFNDALVVEASDSLAAQTYANVIAVRAGEENSEKTKVIMDILTSDECKQFITDHFEGAVLPITTAEAAE